MKNFTKVVFLLTLLPVIAESQSLPNAQTISLYAPANIKIDGKASEWKDKFMAHNTATEIFYSISNDDGNLYLTVQARYRDIIDKILRGGLTLTINHTTNKKDIEHVAITYPVLRGMDKADLTNMMLRKHVEHGDDFKKAINVDDLNTMMDDRSKSVKIGGIKGITDESLSVYNEEGIKAAAKFDKDVAYTYELCIPLKYLTLPDNGKNPFSYNVRINPPDETPAPNHDGPPPPPMAMTATAATDFWGIYTLARK